MRDSAPEGNSQYPVRYIDQRVEFRVGPAALILT